MSKTCVNCFKSNAKPSDPYCPDCGTYFSSRDHASGERAPLLASHGDGLPPSYSEKIPVVTMRPARYNTAVTGGFGDEPDAQRAVHGTQPANVLKSGYGKPPQNQDYEDQVGRDVEEGVVCCLKCCFYTTVAAVQVAAQSEMDKQHREHCCCHTNNGWGSSRSTSCHHCGRYN